MNLSNTISKNPYAVIVHITNNKNQILFVKNKREWELPGGRVEEGEIAREAGMREVREETGVRITHVQEIGTLSHERGEVAILTAQVESIGQQEEDGEVQFCNSESEALKNSKMLEIVGWIQSRRIMS